MPVIIWFCNEMLLFVVFALHFLCFLCSYLFYVINLVAVNISHIGIHTVFWLCKCEFKLVNDNQTDHRFLCLFPMVEKNILYRLVSKGCKLVGCGSAVPSLKISNDELSKIVDTNDEWISVRTGIRNRRVISGQFKHCA